MLIDGLTGKMSAISMLFRGATPGGLLKAVASADGTLTLTDSHQPPLLEFSTISSKNLPYCACTPPSDCVPYTMHDLQRDDKPFPQ